MRLPNSISGIEAYAKYAGTLAQGPEQLLRALHDRDALGQLSYKVWYYPALQYDEDQRNNTINAKRQRVQLLLAKWQQATSWFQPRTLAITAGHRPAVDRRRRPTWRSIDLRSRKCSGCRNTS